MQKFLVTGHNGFIGKNLIEELQQYYNVEGLEDDYTQYKDMCDILYNKLEEINPDVIFHVGACADTLETDVNLMMTKNFETTRVIADWCYKFNRKLIYSSSASCYGVNDTYPSNLYGWSKYIGEKYVISRNGIALRYYNVYGPGEEHKGKMSSVVYQMYLKYRNWQPVKLFPLNPKRDFIYIKDVVNANIHAYTHYKNIPKTFYDVAIGKAYSFEDVMDIMGIGYTYHDEETIPKGYQFFTEGDKKKWLPKWEPMFTLKQGLKEYKRYLDETQKPTPATDSSPTGTE